MNRNRTPSDEQNLHPIVAMLDPSIEQRPAVEQLGRDILVVAGAGTGKTRTLVARYLSLLAEGMEPRTIAAVTFTRKAAREMRNRVRGAIGQYLSQPDLPAGERESWEKRLTELDAARIGTIHSLCSEILRRYPAEAGVDPRFEMLDEGTATIMVRQAVEEVMAGAATDEKLASLFSFLGERKMRGLLRALLSQRGSAPAAWPAGPEALLELWHQALQEGAQHELTAVLTSSGWRDAVRFLEEVAANKPDDRIELMRLETVSIVRQSANASDLAGRMAALAGLEGVNLRGGSHASWEGGEEELKQVKAAIKFCRDGWVKNASQIQIELNDQDHLLAEVMPLVGLLFEQALRRYQALKAERWALDFDDLEEKSLDLLRRCHQVRADWGRELCALLVDEFQDTNERQRELIHLLGGDDGRLFLVGDAKQSIYRFRGADVSVFNQEYKRIETAGGVVVQLDKSYRAHVGLLVGLNHCLKPVLDIDAGGEPWRVPFIPLRPARSSAGRGFQKPFIECHLGYGTKNDGGLVRAANALAARIVELVERCDLWVGDVSSSRPLAYGDVAILCRSSGSFAPYEDALEMAGVPFLTVAGRGFYGRPEIRDLFNALRALNDPTDDIALAGLLRSPAVAMSDEGLFELSRLRDELGEPANLWQALGSSMLTGNTLSESDLRAANFGRRLIQEVGEYIGRATVAEVLKIFLDRTHYRAAFLAAGDHRAARNVAKLLMDASNSGVIGVGEFLEYVASRREGDTREGEARSTAEGAVQIMTVHAAKGLEFPILAVGDMAYSARRTPQWLIDSELGVLWSTDSGADGQEAMEPAAFSLAKRKEAALERAEEDRMLYVAATRAQELLLLSGTLSPRRKPNPQGDSWLERMLGATLADNMDIVPWEAWDSAKGTKESAGHCASACEDVAGASIPSIVLPLRIEETDITCTVYGPGWEGDGCAKGGDFLQQSRLQEVGMLDEEKAALLRPIGGRSVNCDERTMEQLTDPPARAWFVVPTASRPRAPAWIVGSVVHDALGAWRFPAEGFEIWAHARARHLGLTDLQQIEDAAGQARRLLQRLQRHPLYAEIQSAERRLHEVPYSIMTREGLETGTLDLLYVNGAVWTIVEFKTDRLRGQRDLDLWLEETGYYAQARRYVRAVHTLTGRLPRLVFCLLDCNSSVVLKDDQNPEGHSYQP